MTGQRMPSDAVRIYKKMIQNGIEPLIYDHEILLSNKKL
jgi:hypothetical protein